jgi:hypothetical protein
MARANNVVGLRCANPTYVVSDDSINGIKQTTPRDDAMDEIKP